MSHEEDLIEAVRAALSDHMQEDTLAVAIAVVSDERVKQVIARLAVDIARVSAVMASEGCTQCRCQFCGHNKKRHGAGECDGCPCGGTFV